LQAKLFAIPAPVSDEAPPVKLKTEIPPAKSLIFPLRDYVDPGRTSFGIVVDNDAKAFKGTVHVGDDAGWDQEHRTVAAIGDGLVRNVNCRASWGYKIIIEHRLEDGTAFCSLYAHLSPFVSVKPGDRVEQGQKIGAIGRANTWENGGYGAHLHFGIHLGPFVRRRQIGDVFDFHLAGKLTKGKAIQIDDEKTMFEYETADGKKGRFAVYHDADWIGGYLSVEKFKEGRHGWVNPAEFIPKYSAKKEK
jgi:murein DD-endopeptidase MepM/ murein hydrolase activator NlpD